MHENIPYNELLERYRDLQLRVTRFSFVEQQLINTRDQLDSELEMYKKLHDFNSRALRTKEDTDFYQLFVEAIIDLLELELAVVFIEEDQNAELSWFQAEGIGKAHLVQDEIENDLRKLRQYKLDNKSGSTLKDQAFNGLSGLHFIKEALFHAEHDKRLGIKFYILGGISIHKHPLYRPIEKRHETIFSVFVQQGHALISNRRRGTEIEKQIQTISNAAIELRKLSLIATKTKNGVIITDSHGRIEWVNDSFMQSSGYALNEVIGKKPKEFLQGVGTSPAEIEKMRNALQKKERIEVKLVNYRKDGQPYHNLLEITPVFDEHGKHINFIALQKDITAEIQSQQEIMRINSRFELITEKSKIGIWEYYPNVGKVNWNSILLEQYGITEVISEDRKFWLEALHPDQLNQFRESLHQLTDGTSEMIEHELVIHRINDHAERSLKTLVIAERNELGEVQRLVGTTTDITEEKNAAERLRASEEKYRGIIDNMNLGLVELDESGKVVYRNPKYIDMFGSLPPSDLLLLGSGSSSIEIDNTVVSYNKIEDSYYEISLDVPDSGKRHYLVSTASIEKNNHVLKGGNIGIFLDITELKKTQEDVISKNEALRKINNELDNFVYSISHDLRSPLLSIKGILHLIIENRNLNDDDLMFMRLASESTERLDGTIQEILDYSRNSRLELNLSTFNLEKMIQTIFDDLRYANADQVQFDLQFETSSDIYSDHYRLNTILKNFIGNAVKYRRNIEDSFVRVHVFEVNNAIQIDVIDNGEGISESSMNKIFDMFYRGSTNSAGTGLGLYICKEIAEKMNGTISVTSQKGEGSTFSLTLPAAPYQNQNTPAKHQKI
ncbi:MAG: hypothetical protein RL266_2738 [Bacteroidota bacterium]